MPNKKKHWKIFVVQHSHVDVGYTDRQEAIAEYQGQFIEQAVEMAVSPYQRSRDEYTKFKFTCEGFWAVEQFLARTDQKHIESLRRTMPALRLWSAGSFGESSDKDSYVSYFGNLAKFEVIFFVFFYL